MNQWQSYLQPTSWQRRLVLALLVFVGASIQNFAVVLLIGIIAGTYSSLCIAPQLLPDFINGVAVDYRLAHKTFIRSLKSNDSKVFVWTVDKSKEMEKFISRGVDGIITDYPDRMLKIFNQSKGL